MSLPARDDADAGGNRACGCSNVVQFDTPPAQVDVAQFRNTIANFFQARPGLTSS